MKIKVSKYTFPMDFKIGIKFEVIFSASEITWPIKGLVIGASDTVSFNYHLQLSEEFLYKTFVHEKEFARFIGQWLSDQMADNSIPDFYCDKAMDDVYNIGSKYNWQHQKDINAVIHTSGTIKATAIKSVSPVLKSDIAAETMDLPGVQTRVIPACACFNGAVYLKGGVIKKEPVQKKTVWELIQHYNDRHKWSREEIADWLDGLHEAGKINIEF